MKTLKKGLLLAIFSTAIIVLAIYFGLIGGNNLTVFAETQDCKLEQLEAFTNSDSFEYRVNDISYKGTIHDFVENHKDKNGELKVVTWKGGFLNLTTYTWDQRQYVNQFGDAGELVSF